MNTNTTKLNWIHRLGKVIAIFFGVIILPISYLIGLEYSWGEEGIGIAFLYSALFIFIFYFALVLISKIILYIFVGGSFLKIGFSKKQYLLLLVPIILALILSGVFAFVVEPMQEKNKLKLLKENFELTINKYEDDRITAFECADKEIVKYVKNKKKSCSEDYQRTKNSYEICRYINDHDYCITFDDYKSIDCSDEAFRKKASEGAQFLKIQTKANPSVYSDVYGMYLCYEEVIKSNAIILSYLSEYGDLEEIYSISKKDPLNTFSRYVTVLITNGKLDDIAEEQGFNLERFLTMAEEAVQERLKELENQ